MRFARGVVISSIIALIVVISSANIISSSFSGAATGVMNKSYSATIPAVENNIPFLPLKNPPPINTLNVIDNISLGFEAPVGLTIDTWNGHVFVPMNGQSSLSVISAVNDTILTNVSFKGAPIGAAFDTWTGNVYVAENGYIAVVNGTTNTVVNRFGAANDPVYIVFDGNNGYLYEATANSASGFGYITVINGNNGYQVANISAFDPWGMAVDRTNGLIYVADQGLQGVFVINDTTQEIVKSIRLGQDATDTAFDPSNGNIYVADGNRITEINGATNSVMSNYTTSASIFQIAYNGASNDLYVSESSTGNVVIFNCSTESFLKQLSLKAGSPSDIAADPSDNAVFVSTPPYAVTVINGASNTVKKYIDPGEDPGYIGFDRFSHSLYVAETNLNLIKIINGTSNEPVRTVNNSGNPVNFAFNSLNGYVYVSDTLDDRVSFFQSSGNSPLRTANAGTSPEGIVYDGFNSYLYVMDMNSNSVSVISGSNGSTIKSIAVDIGSANSAAPYQGVLDKMNHNIYFTNAFQDRVIVINTTSNEKVNTINIGNQTSGIAYDSWNGYLYVTSPDSNRVAVINGSSDSVVGYVTVGKSPTSITFDTFNGYIFVTNSESGNVSVINGETQSVITSIPVGESPDGIAFDSLNGNVYISNGYSNIVSVIGYPSQDITFHETGLPSGNWYVNITGSGIVSSGPLSGSSFSLNLPAGKYNYTLSTDNVGYRSSPSVGNFSVSSSPLSESAIFTHINNPVYSRIFLYMLSGAVIFAVTISGTIISIKRRNR